MPSRFKVPGLPLQGITMTLGLGTTTMPTAASTLTAPRSSGWRWILPQDSSQSLSQSQHRAQLLRAQSVSMQSSALSSMSAALLALATPHVWCTVPVGLC